LKVKSFQKREARPLAIACDKTRTNNVNRRIPEQQKSKKQANTKYNKQIERTNKSKTKEQNEQTNKKCKKQTDLSESVQCEKE
jgi:hypothetical protein